MIYRLLRFIFRIATRVFYSRVEVEGLSNVPESGPVLLVPNHPNGLLDAAMIAVELPRPLSMTGKSTLAKIPVVSQLMRALHVIPMHRRQDATEGSDPSRNVDSLAECRKRLAEGGALCIFPEGISHSRARLAPLRTGAARIALDYLNVDGNPGGLKIVPVGLLFDGKDQFRSQAVVRFGEPLDPAAWLASNPEAGPRELTAAMEERLHQAALSFDRAGEAWLVRWAAETIGAADQIPSPIGREAPSLARQIALQDRLRKGYLSLKEAGGEELAGVSARVRRYRGELRDLGIDPGEVFLPMSPLRAAWFCVREVAVTLVAGPLALWGAINNALPFLAVRHIALKYSDERCVTSTYALVPSLVLFPAFYALQTIAAAFLLPRVLTGGKLWLTVGVYALLLPVSGYIAIRFTERLAAVLRRARTYLRLRTNPTLRERLRDEGRGISTEIAALAQEM